MAVSIIRFSENFVRLYEIQFFHFRQFHRQQIDHLAHILTNDRMNRSKRPTMLSLLLKMQIQAEIPEWISAFDVSGQDPAPKILQAAMELSSTLKRAEDISKNDFDGWFTAFNLQHPQIAQMYPPELRPIIARNDGENPENNDDVDPNEVSIEDVADAVDNTTLDQTPSFEQSMLNPEDILN